MNPKPPSSLQPRLLSPLNLSTATLATISIPAREKIMTNTVVPKSICQLMPKGKCQSW